jgi:hypothetical protein
MLESHPIPGRKSYVSAYDTEAGGRRGWAPRGSSYDEPVEPQTVTLKWLDT